MRGCVSPEYVSDEFTRLQNHCIVATTYPAFFDEIEKLKRKRTLKPLLLAIFLNFFLEFSLCVIWRSYLIQIVKAFGIPLNANHMTAILSAISMFSCCCFLFSVKTIGKRRLCVHSTVVAVLCSIALSKGILGMNLSFF